MLLLIAFIWRYSPLSNRLTALARDSYMSNQLFICVCMCGGDGGGGGGGGICV